MRIFCQIATTLSQTNTSNGTFQFWISQRQQTEAATQMIQTATGLSAARKNCTRSWDPAKRSHLGVYFASHATLFIAHGGTWKIKEGSLSNAAHQSHSNILLETSLDRTILFFFLKKLWFMFKARMSSQHRFRASKAGFMVLRYRTVADLDESRQRNLDRKRRDLQHPRASRMERTHWKSACVTLHTF